MTDLLPDAARQPVAVQFVRIDDGEEVPLVSNVLYGSAAEVCVGHTVRARGADFTVIGLRHEVSVTHGQNDRLDRLVAVVE